MGFMDELRKLTQPYDDEDDFFEDSDVKYKPQPAPVSTAQAEFEDTFGEEPSATPEPAARKSIKPTGEAGSIFGNLAAKKPARPKPRERSVSFGGNETQVILFSPKSFDEAGELLNHLNQYRSVLMTLEGVPTETARRLLDFLSGITFAVQGKITPVSAKTYFVTPQNVDILGAQGEQPISDEQYF